MDPDRWRRIEELYAAAGQREPRERARFLAEACGEDVALRKEVESLLAAKEAAGDFLAKPALGDSFNLEGTTLPIEEPAIEESATLGEAGVDLAKRLNDRAIGLRAEGRAAEAIEEYQRVIDIYTRLSTKDGPSDLRADLADAHNNRAVALDDQERSSEALADYDRAVEIFTLLVEKEGRAELRGDLAMALTNRAITLRAQGKLDLAVADCDKAIGLRRQLAAREESFQSELAVSLNIRALALREQKLLAEAVKDYDELIAIYTRLVRDGYEVFTRRLVKTWKVREELVRMGRGEGG